MTGGSYFSTELWIPGGTSFIPCANLPVLLDQHQLLEDPLGGVIALGGYRSDGKVNSSVI